MVSRRPDLETLAAIRDHWAARHGGEITGDQIALERKGRLAESTKVTFIPETRQSPAWFICQKCPDALRRHRVDVGVDPVRPPKRHVTAIRRHFREAHGVRSLPAARIYHDPEIPALAIYGPSTPVAGAHVACLMCPDGNNRIIIEDPPYGDARSFAQLRMYEPELARKFARLTPVQRAAQLEAHHRGITAEATQPAVDRALRKLRTSESARELPEAEFGLRVLLVDRVANGTLITRAINDLVDLMETDPVGYACAVAGAIPGLAAHRTLPADDLAALAQDLYGPLERNRRTLWRIWARIPEVERDAAIERGAPH